jgi:hypothetical protein
VPDEESTNETYAEDWSTVSGFWKKMMFTVFIAASRRRD